VRELYRHLNAEGWIDIWLDEEKLLPGQDWEYEIEKALDESDAVIVALSTRSVTKEGYVQKELRFVIDIALEKPEGTIFILPVRLDDCERPRKLRHIQAIDYFPPERRDWAYARLLKSLELRAKRLNLATSAPKEPPPPIQESTILPTSDVSEPINNDPVISPKPTQTVTQPDATPKPTVSNQFWRFIVTLLLIGSAPELGQLLFGLIPDYYHLSGSNFFIGLFLAFLVIILFLVTLVRLASPKSGANKTVVSLERLTAGITSTIVPAMSFALFRDVYPPFPLFLLPFACIIAPTNLFFEFRSTMQQGQKLPGWAMLLLFTGYLSLLQLCASFNL
jgi:hypothetical protein